MTSAVTSADPLVTRMALGRSNDGSQFGMFLQVFADGTVIDSDGVHRLGSAEIRPLYEAIQNGEITRLRGHCGTPSNDFTEYVHVIVFERRMGRLQAHSFSYGGNPQGCESGLRNLHAALENIQAKLSRQPAAAGTPVGTSTTPVPVPGAGPAQDRCRSSRAARPHRRCRTQRWSGQARQRGHSPHTSSPSLAALSATGEFGFVAPPKPLMMLATRMSRSNKREIVRVADR